MFGVSPTGVNGSGFHPPEKAGGRSVGRSVDCFRGIRGFTHQDSGFYPPRFGVLPTKEALRPLFSHIDSNSYEGGKFA